MTKPRTWNEAGTPGYVPGDPLANAKAEIAWMDANPQTELIGVTNPVDVPLPTTLITLIGPEGEIVAKLPVAWAQYPDIVQHGARWYIRHPRAGTGMTAGTYKRATIGVLATGSLTRHDAPKPLTTKASAARDAVSKPESA